MTNQVRARPAWAFTGFAMGLAGCATGNLGPPAPPDLWQWQLGLGLLLAVEIGLFFVTIGAVEQRFVGLGVPKEAAESWYQAAAEPVILDVLGGLTLGFTAVSDGIYRFINHAYGWGSWGAVALIAAFALTGIGGLGGRASVLAYVVFAWSSPNVDLLRLTAGVSIAAGLLSSLLALGDVRVGFARRRQRLLLEQIERPPSSGT